MPNTFFKLIQSWRSVLPLLGLSVLLVALAVGLILANRSQELRQQAAGPSGNAPFIGFTSNISRNINHRFTSVISFNTNGQPISGFKVNVEIHNPANERFLIVENVRLAPELATNADWSCPVTKTSEDSLYSYVELECDYAGSGGYTSSGVERLGLFEVTAAQEPSQNPTELEVEPGDNELVFVDPAAAGTTELVSAAVRFTDPNAGPGQKVPNPVPGDINEDGQVDMADYADFIRDYYKNARWFNQRTNIDGDDRTEVDDYSLFVKDFIDDPSYSSPPAQQTATIRAVPVLPDPTSADRTGRVEFYVDAAGLTFDGIQIAVRFEGMPLTDPQQVNFQFDKTTPAGLNFIKFREPYKGTNSDYSYNFVMGLITEDPAQPFSGRNDIFLGSVTFNTPATGQMELIYNDRLTMISQHQTGDELALTPGNQTVIFQPPTTPPPSPPPSGNYLLELLPQDNITIALNQGIKKYFIARLKDDQGNIVTDQSNLRYQWQINDTAIVTGQAEPFCVQGNRTVQPPCPLAMVDLTPQQLGNTTGRLSVFRDQNLIAEVPLTVTVSDNVGFILVQARAQSIAATATKSAAITFKNTAGAGRDVSQSVQMTSNSQGLLESRVPNITAGTYDVLFKLEGHLQTSFPGVRISSGRNTLTLTSKPQLAGDFNDDNSLSIEDIRLMLSQYTALTVPVTRAARSLDVTADGVLDINDLAAVLANYTQAVTQGES